MFDNLKVLIFRFAPYKKSVNLFFFMVAIRFSYE